ncbi:MAG: cupredoxin domain-containing protein [Sphingomonadales bacterium]
MRPKMFWCVLAVSMIAGASPSQAAPSQYVVTMTNMSYGRVPGSVKVGDTITWVNRDSVPHSITARNKSFDVRVNPGQRAQMVLQKAGSFPFYCLYHPAMRGKIEVMAN